MEIRHLPTCFGNDGVFLQPPWGALKEGFDWGKVAGCQSALCVSFSSSLAFGLFNMITVTWFCRLWLLQRGVAHRPTFTGAILLHNVREVHQNARPLKLIAFKCVTHRLKVAKLRFLPRVARLYWGECDFINNVTLCQALAMNMEDRGADVMWPRGSHRTSASVTSSLHCTDTRTTTAKQFLCFWFVIYYYVLKGICAFWRQT